MFLYRGSKFVRRSLSGPYLPPWNNVKEVKISRKKRAAASSNANCGLRRYIIIFLRNSGENALSRQTAIGRDVLLNHITVPNSQRKYPVKRTKELPRYSTFYQARCFSNALRANRPVPAPREKVIGVTSEERVLSN